MKAHWYLLTNDVRFRRGAGLSKKPFLAVNPPRHEFKIFLRRGRNSKYFTWQLRFQRNFSVCVWWWGGDRQADTAALGGLQPACHSGGWEVCGLCDGWEASLVAGGDGQIAVVARHMWCQRIVTHIQWSHTVHRMYAGYIQCVWEWREENGETCGVKRELKNIL